jgi:hypothetical protein
VTISQAEIMELVDGPEDLDDILAPCVEHRGDCPEPDSRSVAGGTT